MLGNRFGDLVACLEQRRWRRLQKEKMAFVLGLEGKDFKQIRWGWRPGEVESICPC